MENNFIIGGKLGDFMHCLFAVKNICERDGTTANIYMYNMEWERDMNTTFTELQPILLNQPYIKSLNILPDNDINACPDNCINLINFRHSPWLYNACWSDLLMKTFSFKIESTYSWITYNHINEEFKDKVVLFRKNSSERMNKLFPYQEVIEKYGDDMVFVSFNEHDYHGFEYKNKIEFKKIYTLHELFTIINSVKMVVSNLSSPAAIAHSFDKLRIIELPHNPDANHCFGEEKYSKNIFWYSTPHLHNLR